MGEFKTVGLTEDKTVRMISLVYELLAKQESETRGCEITVNSRITRIKNAS
jgi:hypothetical protein